MYLGLFDTKLPDGSTRERGGKREIERAKEKEREAIKHISVHLELKQFKSLT